MNRRHALRGLAALTASGLALSSLAQQSRVWRIGMVHGVTPDLMKPYMDAFLAGLAERGYAPGKNLVIDSHSAHGDPSRYPALIDKVVAQKPDVLVGANTGVAQQMKARTRTIPIVLATSGDPVGDDLVQSLARPGGNVTGVSLQLGELGGKHVELMSELLPRMERVAMLVDPRGSRTKFQTELYEGRARSVAAAKKAVIEVNEFDLGERAADVLRRINAQKPHALIAFLSPRLNSLRREIAREAAALRLPSIAHQEGYAEAGGLMSYGPSFVDAWHHTADFVARILKGADPSTLPVEQARKFTFFLNGRTAKALGLKIPQSLLVRADRVIE